MKQLSFSVEVLMAAYNNADVMRFCLEGLLRQTDRDFSVAVADDGSGPEVERLVNEYRAKGLAIRYVWHEDKGFRKAMIMNRAIGTSTADYMVFIDNDCIPQSSFIADHRHAARRGHFTAGRRINLGPELTDEIVAGKWPISAVDSRWWLLRQAMAGRLRHGEFGLRLPWFLSARWSAKVIGLLGANMAIWREDLIRVNGFDNDIPGGRGEEVDLEWRLRAAGVKPGALLGRAGVAHLWHKTRAGDPGGRPYREAKIARKEVRAVHGIDSPV
jgi:GT2 family glycosyltransferase